MAPGQGGSRMRSAVVACAAAARAGPAGSRVAVAALARPGLALSGLAVPTLAGLRRAGLGGCWLGDRGQGGHGVAGQCLAGLGVATPSAVAWDRWRWCALPGLGLVSADQPRGRADSEQPGDHHHADDQRPAVRPPTAREPRVVRIRLGVGLDPDADQPQRLAVRDDAGRCRLRRGRAVPGIRRAVVHHSMIHVVVHHGLIHVVVHHGLICRRLIHGRLTRGAG